MNKRATKTDARGDTRRIILEVGTRVILEKGYYQCGLSEILQEAGVPKGSFYYYFDSKEDFGLQLIENWLENYSEAEQALKDETLSPLTRARRFFEARHRLCQRLQRKYRAVVGSLHLEMATHNETFRGRVQEVLDTWLGQLAECLAQAQRAGEVVSTLDARALAEFCLVSWEGAMQRARTMQSIAPVELFFHVVFDNFLAGAEN